MIRKDWIWKSQKNFWNWGYKHMREIVIGKNEAGMKLKKLCFFYLKEMPESFTYKMLRKKNILLNEKKASGDELLQEGDKVQFYLSEATLGKLRGEDVEEELPVLSNYPWLTQDRVLYETDDYLFIDKPSGILSQKATAEDRSINDAVIAYLLDKGEVTPDGLQIFRPSVCNRLDRNTSGIIAASKTRKGAKELNEYYHQKDNRGLGKYYLAIVHGHCTLKGHFDRLDYVKARVDNQAYVWMRGGTRPAETLSFGKPLPIYTEMYPLSYLKDKDITLMLFRLHTGRSHQIRVTMQHYGYHVVGDPKYGNPVRDHFLDPEQKGQLLLAYMLRLPDGTPVVASIPEPFLRYFPETAKLAEEEIRKK